MKVELRIKRFDPDRDRRPHWETYQVEMEETDRVLDALHEIRWRQDGTLAFRRSCAHGVCGSDAMLINGHNRLACVLLVKDVGDVITVEPLRGLPVLKDLVVDMQPFFEQYRSVKPWLMPGPERPSERSTGPERPSERSAGPERPSERSAGPEQRGDTGQEGERERLQTPEDRARYDDTTKCILCAACTTSCPVFWGNESFVGPAAIVNAHRFVFDSRDEAASERLSDLDRRSGVWGCRTAFNCTDACPRGIKVTQAIEEVRRATLRGGS